MCCVLHFFVLSSAFFLLRNWAIFRLHCMCSCSIKHHTKKKLLCGSAMVVMYNEMIMMTMMLLRYSIVVTNNNCFRIILNSLYFSSLTKKREYITHPNSIEWAKCMEMRERNEKNQIQRRQQQQQQLKTKSNHYTLLCVHSCLVMCVSVHGFTHHLIFKDWSLVYPRSLFYQIHSLSAACVVVIPLFFISSLGYFFVLIDFDC